MLGLVGCAFDDNTRYEDMLKISFSHLKMAEEYDSHGGFNGDGISFYKYLANEEVLNEIKANDNWKAFPMNETVKSILYGGEYSDALIVDEKAKPLMPEVKNGYYILIDRHEEANEGDDEKTIFNRYSLNYTVAIYDVDNQYLYITEQDT